MWATWILAASFTILILAGFEIVPQWSKPYPESAMFQALLVLLVGIGWLLGLIPTTLIVQRGEMNWITPSKAWAFVVVLGTYVLVASGAVWAIAMGTARNAPSGWKTAALIAGFVVPLAFGFYARWLLEPAWRPSFLDPRTMHRAAIAIFTTPAIAGLWAWFDATRSFGKWR